jgi:hypothetical protein
LWRVSCWRRLRLPRRRLPRRRLRRLRLCPFWVQRLRWVRLWRGPLGWWLRRMRRLRNLLAMGSSRAAVDQRVPACSCTSATSARSCTSADKVSAAAVCNRDLLERAALRSTSPLRSARLAVRPAASRRSPQCARLVARHQVRRRSPSRLVREIDVGERLPVRPRTMKQPSLGVFHHKRRHHYVR